MFSNGPNGIAKTTTDPLHNSGIRLILITKSGEHRPRILTNGCDTGMLLTIFGIDTSTPEKSREAVQPIRGISFCVFHEIVGSSLQNIFYLQLYNFQLYFLKQE